MSALFIIFTAFFSLERFIQMRRDNFSLFDSDTESIQVQWIQKATYKQHTSNIQIEVGKVLFTITFAGSLTPEIIGDRVRKRRDNFR